MDQVNLWYANIIYLLFEKSATSICIHTMDQPLKAESPKNW